MVGTALWHEQGPQMILLWSIVGKFFLQVYMFNRISGMQQTFLPLFSTVFVGLPILEHRACPVDSWLEFAWLHLNDASYRKGHGAILPSGGQVEMVTCSFQSLANKHEVESLLSLI